MSALDASAAELTGRLETLISGFDLLLVLPPYADTDKPSLGLHILQACCGKFGIKARVVYANLIWAKLIGAEAYNAICRASGSELLGERCFSKAAFGINALQPPSEWPEPSFKRSPASGDISASVDWQNLATQAEVFCDHLARVLASSGAPVIGCSTMFEQTAASLAILSRVKSRVPSIVTIIGGPNCEGEMARGISDLGTHVDYVFSGESEQTLPTFMGQLKKGVFPQDRIVMGMACRDMDSLPCPDYSEFFQQRQVLLGEDDAMRTDLWLTYESSRGCWWGQKSQCTFCGINGTGMNFREKSPERVLEDLKTLTTESGVTNVCMVDNIMPHRYFKSLLHQLEKRAEPLHIFYEQKANLTLDKVAALKRAHIGLIQPGIEALNDQLLMLMKKGVTTEQNIALLRYARIAGLGLNWNILYAFPGDKAEWYADTLGLLPMIRHLHPPTGMFPLTIDRFSPYFDHPELYKITNLRPMKCYEMVFGQNAPLDLIAYHFEADYESGSRQDYELVAALKREVEAWRNAWLDSQVPPVLAVVAANENSYLLIDSRGNPETLHSEMINRRQASLALFGPSIEADQEVLKWATERRLLALHNGKLIPLAIAGQDLMDKLRFTS